MMTISRVTSESRRSAIPILYEDNDVVVFNKPANLLVIPAPGKTGKTMMDWVNDPAIRSGEKKLHPCHRLDMETSGALIFAKGKTAQKTMMELFHRNGVEKAYIGFIHGRLEKRSGEIKSWTVNLERRQAGRHSSRRESVLRFEVSREYSGFSVARIYPLTGRTNQIRIQLSQVGHPLLGERKYAVAKDFSLKFRRVALHAEELRWLHPVSGSPVVVTAGLPDDMKQFLARYR
jgi:23S rRNA pseudouridine1911/1915/1917 synthase